MGDLLKPRVEPWTRWHFPDRRGRNPGRSAAVLAACLAGLLLASGLALAVAPIPGKAPARVPTDVHDLVFLAEAKPILIRLHVRVDGKPVESAYDDFMKYLFAYLDVNGDGVLSKEEAERAPSIDQIRAGGIPNGRGMRGGRAAANPAMKDLDADQDGKVTLAELTAYYRKSGFVPFQVQLAAGQNAALGALAFLGRRPDPSVDEISEAIFKLLDTNKDGKLTKEELAAAPSLLLRLDEDEDEIITAQELVPNGKASAGSMFARAGMMMGGGGKSGSAGSKMLVRITTPGKAPAELVRSMQERYGPKAKKAQEKKLTRKDLGLDEATFAPLDSNKDGVLDGKELAGFVKRPPDFELTVRLGSRKAVQAGMELVTARDRASIRMKEELALLDLGATRVELRTSEEEDRYDVFGDLIRQQYRAQFSGADKEGKGYLTQKEAEANPLLRGRFKAMDRDGDGKLTEKEVMAYLDQYQKLQARATASSVSLVLADQSRGLFDLLDVNRDGRLSVREMRGAVGLLDQLDHDGKGYLTRKDVPRSYLLTLRRGAGDEGANDAAAFAKIYGGGDATRREPKRTAGPRWFRKMDRNRDGDVSRKEWIFSEELFRKIDADGDGLISVEEAERYDALLRKQP